MRKILIVSLLMISFFSLYAEERDPVKVTFTPGADGNEVVIVGFSNKEVKTLEPLGAGDKQTAVSLTLNKGTNKASYDDGKLYLYYQIISNSKQTITLRAVTGLKTESEVVGVEDYINYTATVNNKSVTSTDGASNTTTDAVYVFDPAAAAGKSSAAGSYPISIETGVLPVNLAGTYSGNLTVVVTADSGSGS